VNHEDTKDTKHFNVMCFVFFVPSWLAKTMLTPKEVRHLIIDMDGVLWRGDVAMPGLGAFFDGLRALGIGFMLATNNAAKSAPQFAEKLARMGATVHVPEIMTSSIATALMLSRERPGAKVGVIGEEGLKGELRAAGLDVLPQTRWGEAAVIAVGIDRHLTYAKLVDACLAIRAGAQFVGTNPDVTFPGERGIVPGNGAIVQALRVSTGVEPRIVGKPMPDMMLACLERMGARAEDTVALGDRLDTDILGGQRAGLRTIMVESGVSTRAEADAGPIHPDLVMADVGAVLTWLRG
jgi:4-nitrophenyl phosphatase